MGLKIIYAITVLIVFILVGLYMYATGWFVDWDINRDETVGVESGIAGPPWKIRREALRKEGRLQAGEVYVLGDRAIHGQDGECFPIAYRVDSGWLDNLKIIKTQWRVWGWAADLKNKNTADKVIIFLDKVSLAVLPTGVSRPDVAKRFKDDRLAASGFERSFTGPELADLKQADVHVFSISSQGVASELRYNKRLPFIPLPRLQRKGAGAGSGC